MAIPDPEPGMVIAHAYLWHHEQRAGQEEGRKIRPSIVVLAAEREAGSVSVIVLPITHRMPNDPARGIEIPTAVKRHLGLDADRAWIIVDEGNEFVWPGYDLRRIAGSDRYHYGFLPPRFFDRELEAFVAWHRAGVTRVTPRD